MPRVFHFVVIVLLVFLEYAVADVDLAGPVTG